ncbi:MAG TPA: indole-3-glycerol phosphate synthase TrpC [Candidatus Omnitrophota bacterium]|nr:indole-3-glycerol phosphate synthase TrpC [Candidatus Omnitrophota bacterium]
MILNDILLQKKKYLEELKQRMPLQRLQRIVEKMERPNPRPFRSALISQRGLNIIAELKKASPSEGVLREDFQPLRIATLFEYAGACAISVLTESHFFKGRPSYLKTVRQVTNLPLLRKDFIFERYQLYETAILEADAFLLIASILSEEELKELIALGKELRMDALVEVHSDAELKKALNADAKIIGINNRDLKTLSVDPDRAQTLIPHVPKGIAIVVESGLKTHEELLRYKSLGANAFLIGSALIQSKDIAKTLQRLLGKKESSIASEPQ